MKEEKTKHAIIVMKLLWCGLFCSGMEQKNEVCLWATGGGTKNGGIEWSATGRVAGVGGHGDREKRQDSCDRPRVSVPITGPDMMSIPFAVPTSAPAVSKRR